MTAAIETAGLDAGYGAVQVVRDLSLRVDAGEVVALLGPNGAGKTTTLLTMSGLLPPLAGTVRLSGRPVGKTHGHLLARQGLAHVPQDRSLSWGLTAREHLRLAGRRDKRAIDRVLTVLPELEPLLDRAAGVLSGGEQQLLALGRAIASRPRWMILDEVSTGLAPAITERVLAWLRDLAGNEGVAVLLVEQHVALALRYAARAYVLRSGVVVAEGPSVELASRPDLLQTAYMGPST